MKHRVIALILFCAVLFIPARPAVAGGWVIVELVEPLPPVVAGEAVTFDVRVLQHGVRPVVGSLVTLEATHRETAATLAATSVENDAKDGTYRFEVTFPVAGEWKWQVTVDPYPGMTAFPTLNVAGAVATPQAAVPAGAGVTRITITDIGFEPASVTVPAGSMVEWINAGSLPHQVASDALSFDNSPMLQQGESYLYTVQEPGTIAYICGPHPSMQGTVVIM